LDKDIKKINDIMVNLFNLVTKTEEDFIKKKSNHDLSVTEIHTLVAIGVGRPKTMTHVANLLEINVSTLTTAINKLVKKGYVERLRNDKDRRMVKIGLTELGVSAVEEHDVFHEEMISAAISKIGEDQLPQLISAIDNISQFLAESRSMGYQKDVPFDMSPLDIGPHKLPVPIVQAGMSIGVAGENLASAVAIEGGLGLIASTELDLDALECKIKAAKKKVKDAGGKGLIGVNIMWNMANCHEYLDVAVKSGAQVIVTSAGLPSDLPRYCTDKKVALIPTISSRRGAAAIIKTWGQRYNRMPDAFILQGPTAAGLLGFKESELSRATSERFKIIAEVKAELLKLEKCPLIVSGGIYGKEDAEKVYKYGADGVMMGTRFVVTEECDAAEEYKKLYLNCTENDVTIVKSPMKTSVRAMKNTFVSELASSEDEDYDIIEAVKRGVEGDYDGGMIFCAAKADKVKSIDRVSDVFKEFTT
jgi:NAD(P)H-dependent flavin oxidoreductase YrpB (nitropropane dioxygenase family)/DNA-binding MarR family transcriptional regulator